jgi:Zn-dependent M28 family amino/carboxypeptidase
MTKSLALIGLAILLAGCQPSVTPPPPVDWNAFDGDNAFRHVEQQVNFGPRPSGSEALGKAGDYIVGQLREAGLDVVEQRFRKNTPRGEIEFRNIIGKTRGPTPPGHGIVIFGSHYDTKWMPDIQFVGANDAGSSTGALLEMARVAAHQPGLWFVLFDGEECMVEYGPNDGFWGSQYFVGQLGTGSWPTRGQISAFILLDMVGDRDLRVTIPPSSTGPLVLGIFDAARALGWRDHFAYADMDIMDDHTAFLDAGIPAVDLIDFDYGSTPGENDHWHTAQDTLDKVSPRSLEIVGRTALKWLASSRQKQATAR